MWPNLTGAGIAATERVAREMISSGWMWHGRPQGRGELLVVFDVKYMYARCSLLESDVSEHHQTVNRRVFGTGVTRLVACYQTSITS